MRIIDSLTVTDDGWGLVESGWDPERSVAVGSNFLCGNGYLGYRGTSPEQTVAERVALVVSDTYDCADGHWRELTTAPNPLFVAAEAGGQTLTAREARAVESRFDLRLGELTTRLDHQLGEARLVVETRRLASLDDLHLLSQQVTLTSDAPLDIELTEGIDGEIWSLNGTHLPELNTRRLDESAEVVGTTVESGVELAVVSRTAIDAPTRAEPVSHPRSSLRRHRLRLEPGRPVTVETHAAVVTSNDGVADPRLEAARRAERGAEAGYDSTRRLSAQRWQTFWDRTDVTIEGDLVDQVGVRFAAYHNRICTPAHTDHLPIGARGLSCQAYQGAAFWDQEVYNLPALLFTEPDIARSLLVYRHRTLDGARRKAARLGYQGAYYAWISGDTGDELCPDVFFTDVLTGREIRNHFNVWQMHIAPDVVTTLADYVEVTGDRSLLIEHGLEIAVEVARFLRSFVLYDEVGDRYRCIRLLGPDEWHENVDDNAFTNHQVHRALDVTIAWCRQLADDPEAAVLVERLGVDEDELAAWERVRDRLHRPGPDPDTGLIEQFDGFFDLEDVSPDEVRSRLIDPGEYWGWPNGVAVRTQVAKQADIAMLLWLHPELVDADSARTNYEYYEARCAHGSSLSHAAHGMVAARLGLLDRAHEHYRHTALVDLANTQHAVVGGTFIGGIHTAACGGTYQLAVQGLGGLGFADGTLIVDPRLPSTWRSMSYPVTWRGRRLRVTVTRDQILVEADAANPEATPIRIRGRDHQIGPGQQAVFAEVSEVPDSE